MTRAEKIKRRDAMARLDEQAVIPDRSNVRFDSGRGGLCMGMDPLMAMMMVKMAVMARKRK
jgi:hypothetical protein